MLGIPDYEFIRGEVPMTKEEIRILSVVKLRLTEDAVVYDIGAGTGSVSVEIALACPKGTVYAVEENPAGIELIKANRDKFKADNIVPVAGFAPDCMEDLPVPTHVFIGGSKGRLLEIIEKVLAKNPEARIVVNAVTLETLGKLSEMAERFPACGDMEVTEVMIAKSSLRGRYHFMKGENPVYIAAFGKNH